MNADTPSLCQVVSLLILPQAAHLVPVAFLPWSPLAHEYCNIETEGNAT